MEQDDRLGRYRLERVLGTGTFATVWLARDEALDRRVAVKVLADNWSRDHDVRRRFLAEARVLLTAETSRITRGFELGETDGRPYLVMAWADRGTLAGRVDARSRTGVPYLPNEAAAILREIALAVDEVHTLGHLHRDVKPSNVLIGSAGDDRVAGLEAGERLMLGDFGLARGIDASAITVVAGSPGYVAPEQASGRVQIDRRADLYPLGRIGIELLTGDPGGRATTMVAAANEVVDPASVLAEHQVAAPMALVELLAGLLAFDPDDRPATAAEVAEALAPLTDPGVELVVPMPTLPASPPSPSSAASPSSARHGPPTVAPSPRRSTGWLREATRRPKLGAAMALVAVMVAVVVAVVANRLTDGDKTPASTASTDRAPGDAIDAAPGGTRATIPMPDIAAVQEDRSDESRTVAFIADDVDGVVDRFTDPPPDSWEVVEQPVDVDGVVTFVLSNGAHRATVELEAAARSAVRDGVTQIVVEYDP